MEGTTVIAGMGPGFCEAFAHKAASEGRPVAFFSRNKEYLMKFESELRDSGYEARGIPVDVTVPTAVNDGMERVRNELGPIETLAYTASTVTNSPQESLDPNRFEQLWRVYALGGLHCFRAALQDLSEAEGTVLFFGASPTGGDFAFKSGKDAMRGLARSLADKYGSTGIHVAHVIIDGKFLNPDVLEREQNINEDEYIDLQAAADTCHHLVDQPHRSRTFELDLHANERTTVH